MDLKTITPCLWFDGEAEEAARFYVGIFPGSRITAVTRYPEDLHGMPAGSVLTVAFELGEQPFTALNGGPMYRFSEAISLQVLCDTQEEIDRLWSRLADGGDPRAQQCGWLKDRFGLSWQVVPRVLSAMLADPDPARKKAVMAAFLPMKKFDLVALERAYRDA
jgi:predicted 3-demethylubiquinone-9 3-methyltransferase (glyoxalase superfamily)